MQRRLKVKGRIVYVHLECQLLHGNSRQRNVVKIVTRRASPGLPEILLKSSLLPLLFSKDDVSLVYAPIMFLTLTQFFFVPLPPLSSSPPVTDPVSLSGLATRRP